MNCPFCQAEVDPDQSICPSCGAALAEQQIPATSPQAETVAAPLPLSPPGQQPTAAAGRALFLSFNEKPVNILGVMDEAKRRQGEFFQSYQQRLRILLLLLPAGLLFLLLDWGVNRSFRAFTLVACVLWGAALVGWLVLRRASLVAREEKPKAPGGVVFGRVFLVFWFLLVAAIVLWSVGLFSFLARNPLLALAVVLAVVALVGLRQLWRHPPTGEAFGTRFDEARTLFETLKDDLAPKRTLLGWLDLTSAQQPGKVVRESTSGSGALVKVYRDEWLRIKMPLYDGNLMRVSAVERVKAKLGRWKRNVRGKYKWKPARKPLVRHELRVSFAVNAAAYQVLPFEGGQVGKFAVAAPQIDSSRLALVASTQDQVGAWDILRLLRFAYDHIQPLQATGSAEATSASPERPASPEAAPPGEQAA